jgi:hypothetical protein
MLCFKYFTDQACGRILAGFAMKWPTRDRTFEKRCFILAVLCYKICRFAICGLEDQRIWRICLFRIDHEKIAELTLVN